MNAEDACWMRKDKQRITAWPSLSLMKPSQGFIPLPEAVKKMS
jgi:hypothetical protein